MAGVWNYQPITETRYKPGFGQYHTYGIQASRKTVRGWEQIELLHDVTTSSRFAEKPAELFNLYQLSPIHLRDILEDLPL